MSHNFRKVPNLSNLLRPFCGRLLSPPTIAVSADRIADNLVGGIEFWAARGQLKFLRPILCRLLMTAGQHAAAQDRRVEGKIFVW